MPPQNRYSWVCPPGMQMPTTAATKRAYHSATVSVIPHTRPRPGPAALVGAPSGGVLGLATGVRPSTTSRMNVRRAQVAILMLHTNDLHYACGDKAVARVY